MKHIIAIVIKFIMVSVILEFVLNFMTALTFSKILTISLSVTLLTYLIADIIIMPLTNHTLGAVADTGLAIIMIYMYNFRPGFGAITMNAALVSAVFIGVGEYFFHRYLSRSVLSEHKRGV